MHVLNSKYKLTFQADVLEEESFVVYAHLKFH